MQAFKKRAAAEADALPGLPAWEAELLWARGIRTPEAAEVFLHPSLDQLHDPFRMPGMVRAVKRIEEAVERREKILVYGDYDVDGICAVTVLLETLLEWGADADFRIPLRHSEGYGLNTQAVRDAAEAGVRLLITVDCGISNVTEVRLAKELGMDVIVTDHHEIPAELPPADAILDPLLGEYPFPRLCGAGVALKICHALLGPESMEEKLEIAALATVADIVPLQDENRVIVREGMLRLERTRRPGLRAMMENAKVTFPMHAEDIAFRLAPRLNAAGRLEDAALGVRLLRTKDPAEGKALADHLEENNRKRQAEEQKIIAGAMALLEKKADLRRDRAIVLDGEGWNPGLIGLAAGKLCERFHHPVVVLTCKEDGEATGSCRSVPGINIWEMLNRCGDLFVRFGGHAQAAGLTIRTEKIPEFRRRLNAAIRESCPDSCFVPEKEYDSEMALKEVTLETVEALEALEPTGFGNPAPVFLCRGAQVQTRRVGRDGSHLKLTLWEGDTVRDGIGFGLAYAAGPELRRADVLFRPTRNEFGGRISAQLQAEAIRPARGETEEDLRKDPDGFFLACLQEMAGLAANEKENHPETGILRPEHLLKERLEKVDPGDDALRKVYLALRGPEAESLEALAEAAGCSREQALLALTAFAQLELLTWDREPFRVRLFPVKKVAPAASPVVRYLRDIGCGPEMDREEGEA